MQLQMYANTGKSIFVQCVAYPARGELQLTGLFAHCSLRDARLLNRVIKCNLYCAKWRRIWEREPPDAFLLLDEATDTAKNRFMWKVASCLGLNWIFTCGLSTYNKATLMVH